MDVVVRIALVYVILMVGFRVLGKRELSKLSPFELVTLLIIPEIVAPALTAGEHSFTGALFGVATLLCLAFLNSLSTYTLRPFRAVSESPFAVLVQDGQLIADNLHKERIRPDEIYSEMRLSGIEDLAQVKWAILEPGGKLSFVRRDGGEVGAAEDDDPG